MPKPSFRYRYRDMSEVSAPLSRERVCYLLRAARSRVNHPHGRRNAQRRSYGYLIADAQLQLIRSK